MDIWEGALDESRFEILKQIEQGKLSVEEGFRLINQIEETEKTPAGIGIAASEHSWTDEEPIEKARVLKAVEPEPTIKFGHWKIWSWIGFGIFLLLTMVSAVWMIQGWRAHPWGWGFWLSWIPFLIGIGGMALMFNSRWLHIRIRQAKGEKPERIAISIPFPLGLVLWIMKTFPQWVPEKARGVGINEFLDEVNRGISKEQPIYVQVDDEDGEHVEIYIG